MPNLFAPPGTVFVCGACGKRSLDTHGTKKIDRGWDSSCFMHAVLCWDAPVNGQWMAADGKVPEMLEPSPTDRPAKHKHGNPEVEEDET